jgi:hypothetical protein
MRKLPEPGSMWPQPKKPSRFLRQQHLTKEDWMSFKFLITINSRCTTIEVALSVDGILNNVLTQLLPDTLYILWKHLQEVWNPAKYNYLWEYKWKTFSKIRWIIWSETRLSIIIYLQQPSWCRVCHQVVLTCGMPYGIHTKRTHVAAEHTALRYQNEKLMQYQIGKKEP